ncbi:MAG TPA: cation:dicarboxylase symporter family transporter, partial [Vicinamibacterales bacterium]|nr:cation:dicarboxylase symporter family transporter [Vicinamibacterales bacterium]
MKINVPETVPAAPAQRSRIPSNTTQIFIGLLLGIAIGYMFPSSDANGVHTAGIGEQIKPIADTFLRMIKMIIAPLLFSTLVVGIAGTGDLKSMGRIGLKAIIYFEVATTIALFLGLFIVNVFQPGVGVQAPALSTDSLKGVQAIQAHTGWDMLVSLIPTSVVDAMARGDILQLVVFSIFFGVGLAAVGEKGRAVTEVLESTAQVMFKFTGYVMMFAPLGVMAAISATVGKMGIGILFTLGKLVVLMYLGLIVFAIVVVGGVSVLIRVPFFTFMRAIKEPFLIAFT